MTEKVSDEILHKILDSFIKMSGAELGIGSDSLCKMALVPPPPSEQIAVLIPEMSGFDSPNEALTEVEKIVAGQKKMPEMPEVSAFVTIMEAWAVFLDKDDPTALFQAMAFSPSQHPNRVEVLIAQAFDPDGLRIFKVKKIVRDDDGNYARLEDYQPGDENLQESASVFDPWQRIRQRRRKGPYA